MSDNEARENLKRVAEVASVKHLEESLAEYRAATSAENDPTDWELEFWHAGYKRGALAMIDHQLATKAEPLTIDRGKLIGALTNVLSNASNYPDAVQSRILGQDMAPLVDKVTDAVIAHLALSAQEATTEVEWGVRIPGENAAYTQIFDNEWAAKESAASDKSWCSTAPRVIETRRVTRTLWQEVPADE